jgi:hypothetical protein
MVHVLWFLILSQTHSYTHTNKHTYAQDRDSAPVRDSKMQSWRDGLIKEMASKRQGGVRPPAAATAK